MHASMMRLLVLLGGIVACQIVLFGPSLIGSKILLPVDVLAQPGVYLPQTPETQKIVTHDPIMSDLVLFCEPARLFAVSEIRAGRLPIWSPYEYAGVPVWRLPLCPAWILNYLIESPVVLAWSQLLLAITAGVGAWLFFRRVLGVSYWPATITAWCFPISGYFIIWQGGNSPPVMVWLPWLLTTVHRAVLRPWSWGVPATALFTWAALISGAPDIAGEVLLASGIFALWVYVDHYGNRSFAIRPALSLVSVSVGWGLGMLLAAPLLFPMLEYAHTGARMTQRGQGAEERPPVGLAELPQLVLPDMYGLTQAGNARIVNGNRPESSASGYAGLLATVLFAPLAWCSGRHRSFNVLWMILAFLGMSWALNVPGVVQIMRMPGLNMMSFNRWTFITSFAILAMTGVGLEVVWNGCINRQKWFFVPLVLAMTLLCWCVYRVLTPPEPIASQLAKAVLDGTADPRIHGMDGVALVQKNFTRSYEVAAILSLLALAGWVLFLLEAKLPAWGATCVGLMLVADLLWFGHGVNAQSDPRLYFPRIPVLEQVANAEPGRIIGYSCLPPKLSTIPKLRDVRGYDGVDPGRHLELLQMKIASDPRGAAFPYAAVQWYLPRYLAIEPPDGIRLPPVFDMLGVRYLIFRGQPPANLSPAIRGDDYWVLQNRMALPRAFVPRQVKFFKDEWVGLAEMSSPDFNPRAVAYVESPVELPSECRGMAGVEEESPVHVKLFLSMETPGLVVLADRWDTGWRAYLNGKSAPILPANHALRGVIAPAGASELEFRYEPDSLKSGLRLAGVALVALVAWVVMLWRKTGIPVDVEGATAEPAN